MPTLDATVGGANSNAYDTVANGDTYFDERLQVTLWTGGDADDQARALIMATRRIDQELFEGEKTSTGQALKWPRIGATDDDGYEYGSAAIPTIVKHAMFEQALAYLVSDDSGEDALANTGLEGFKKVKVAVIEAEIDKDYIAGDLTENAMRLLRPVLIDRRHVGSLLRA